MRSCPKCLNKLTAQTGLHNFESIPQKHDFIICGYCLAILQFNEDLTLRIVTRSQLKAIQDRDPEFIIALIRAQSIAKMALTIKQVKQN